MAAPKRTLNQIERDRAQIASMYLSGAQQIHIVEKLTLQNDIEYSLDMIKRDLIVLRKRWRESSLRDFDEARAEQLEKLDVMELAAWEQWNRSCLDYKKTTTGSSLKEGAFEKEETGIQTGDPRYLTIIHSCIDRRCKLLGLYAPTKISPTNPEGDKPYQPTSAAEVEARTLELLKKLGHASGNS